MLDKLQATNFHLECYEENEYDHNYPPSIKFSLPYLTFIPEQGSLEWEKLVDAIENNRSFSIDWRPCNGACEIQVNGEMTNFCVAKYGDGLGGSLTITIPSSLCLDAFKLASEITVNWMK